MKRILLSALVAVLAVPGAAGVAHAQIAAAIGKPLPSPDLPAGTVSVRVVAGSPSSPVGNTEVTLTVNGTPQIARTDEAGRAHFKDLPPGAQVQAKVFDEDKKEVTSDPFSLPADTGVRLMLTTRPWNPGGGGGGGGAPFAGGAGMPNPRQMSGEPRPEDADAPGMLTVRLTYDDFKDAPPVGQPVALVGYSADDSVKFQIANSDKDGRAKFSGLDRSGATAYFAMTLLPRGTGVERLISSPVVNDPRVGVRLILSGEKRTSTEPNVDDLGKLDKQDNPPPAGKVRVGLEGAVEDGEVRLVDAESKNVIGRGKPTMSAPDPQDIEANAKFDASGSPGGTLDVLVHGGGGGDNNPIPNISIKVASEDAPDVIGEAQTGADGKAQLKVTKLDKQLVATITVNGKPLTTKPFDLAKQGGTIDVEAHWDTQGKPEVVFDLIPRPGQVVYAETTMRNLMYRSLPFQPVADRGTRATLFIFPRLLFSFSLTSRIDDEYLAVNGRFELSNNSWEPYLASADGIIVPLPKGFVGGLVADKDQQIVAIEPKQGFRIIRAIPPGMTAFHGAFSVPVERGSVHWGMDLPWGAFNSGMEILQVPGMTVDTPKGVQGKVMTVPQGTYFVLPQIQIMPHQAMVMDVHGLPSAAAWHVWVPRLIGVLVILIILGGVTFAVLRIGPQKQGTVAIRRQQLLDALVAMDKAGSKNDKRREELIKELESLWDEGST